MSEMDQCVYNLAPRDRASYCEAQGPLVILKLVSHFRKLAALLRRRPAKQLRAFFSFRVAECSICETKRADQTPAR
jgi:hypothetical protein